MRDTGRGKSRFPEGSQMLDLIPGPWDHDLSQRQVPNCCATQGSPFYVIVNGVFRFHSSVFSVAGTMEDRHLTKFIQE